MTKNEAAHIISDRWDISRGDAIELIEDFALNSGEVETVDQITDVRQERVKEILEHLDHESEYNTQLRRAGR